MKGLNSKTVIDLLDLLEHEANGIKTVIVLWSDGIPEPVKRSIGKRVRCQTRVIARLRRLVYPVMNHPFSV